MKERGSDHGRYDNAFPAGRSTATSPRTTTAATHRNRSIPSREQQHQGSLKGSYRKLLCALLVGFYLGATVTMWVHTWNMADSHMQHDDRGKAMGLVPPHALDWWQQYMAASNCSDSKTLARAVETGDRQKPSPTPAGSPLKQEKTMPSPAPTKHPVVKAVPPPKEQSKPQEKQQPLTAPEMDTLLHPQSLASPEELAKVRDALQHTYQRSFLPLQAVVETPTLSNLAHRNNNYTYSKPLPLRTSSKLHTFTYFQNVHSCRDLPNGWPVDHPQELDPKFGNIFGDLGSLYRHRMEYAEIACPVDADPFLPWIHDVFPTTDGRYIEFVAHNKRRCRQDPAKFRADIDNLEPQVALIQSIPVQRVSKEHIQAHTGIPAEWKSMHSGEQRYRLASIAEADFDGKETRFICQFHTLKPTSEGGVQKIVLGETLSVYPYNYEHANYQHRPGQRPNPMLTRPVDDSDVNGIHNEQIWNAILHFRCPVPVHLQKVVAQGSSVDPTSGVPSIYVDVVPIRTPPREGVDGYNAYHLDVSTFDPVEEWGPAHILPPVDKSGRWANIPICPPAVKANDKDFAIKESKNALAATSENSDVKSNYLVGCLWASAAFSARGEDILDTSTSHRLLEWLTYHLEVAGFDKMVVYDNTEAFTNVTSLQSITDLFPGRVERIPWKHRVCNNNRPTHPNAGERSSQYAAEASCRIRYGPTTEWMISFDTDEYLVPQGKHTSLREWLKESVRSEVIGKEAHVLNFYQIRASLNKRFTERYYDDTKYCRSTCKSCHCLAKRPNATFFESFCDPVRFPKPDWTGRAKKQLYHPSFVLNHFVHYAAVTRMIIDEPGMPRVVGYPYERRVAEANEAFMLHTKTKAPRRTSAWQTQCKEADECPIGIPWPHFQDDNEDYEEGSRNEDGYPYNCWESRKIHEVLAGKLRSLLVPYERKWSASAIVPHKREVSAKNIEYKISGVKSATAKVVNGSTSVGGTPEVTIRDFEPGLPAVIATKIQGNSTLLQLEQALCLLKYAYNDRPNYDIVVFTATPITEAETNILKAAAAPAKLSIAMDNPGLQTMVADLKPKELEYLLKRCNVTEASQLTWKTRCLETSSGGTTNMPIQYTWQAEFRSLHLWKHPAIARYKYMMWLDSDGFCTRVRTNKLVIAFFVLVLLTVVFVSCLEMGT